MLHVKILPVYFQVKHVINFEFPSFISDYIHRGGRVGRVGSHGTGTVHNYISKIYEVELLWEIEVSRHCPVYI